MKFEKNKIDSDKSTEPIKREISRRDFLKFLGLGTAAVVLEACGSPAVEDLIQKLAEKVEPDFSYEKLRDEFIEVLGEILKEVPRCGVAEPDFSDSKLSEERFQIYKDTALDYAAIRQHEFFKNFDEFKSEEEIEKKIYFIDQNEFKAIVNKLVEFLKEKQESIHESSLTGIASISSEELKAFLGMTENNLRELIYQNLDVNLNTEGDIDSDAMEVPPNPYFKGRNSIIFTDTKSNKTNQYFNAALFCDFEKVKILGKDLLYLFSTIIELINCYSGNQKKENFGKIMADLNYAFSRCSHEGSLLNDAWGEADLADFKNLFKKANDFDFSSSTHFFSSDEFNIKLKKLIENTIHHIDPNLEIRLYSSQGYLDEPLANGWGIDMGVLSFSFEKYGEIKDDENKLKEEYYGGIFNLIKQYSDEVIIDLQYYNTPIGLIRDNNYLYVCLKSSEEELMSSPIWKLELKEEWKQ
jgi:hypothetical protein